MRGLFIVSGLAFLSVSATARAQDTWRALAPVPAPTHETRSVAANGKIYMFAGLGRESLALGYVYEYDPAKNAWTAKKPMPVPAHHIALTEYDGKIYIFGGFKRPASGEDGWQIINNSWEYDPLADTWRALRPLPLERGAAEAAVVNGKIYVVGGATLEPGSKAVPIISSSNPRAPTHRTVGTVEEYDVSANTWRGRSSMPTPRNHFVLETVNGKLYAIGGRNGSVFGGGASATDSVEEFDPATDMWGAPKARMSTRRCEMVSGVYMGRIYVVGGELYDARESATFRTAEAFDPETNEWSALPLVPQSRVPVAGTVMGDKFYLLSTWSVPLTQTNWGKDAPSYPVDSLRLSDLK
jgi:N-acetylneuraminic acid mutarotase